MFLSEVLDHKGWKSITVRDDVDIETAVQTMSENRVGSVLVLDSQGDIVGILAERDVVRGLSEHGADLGALKVADVMSSDVVSAESGAQVEDILDIMTEKRARHIPVIRNGALVGIVSIGDLVKGLLRKKIWEAEELRDYIRG